MERRRTDAPRHSKRRRAADRATVRTMVRRAAVCVLAVGLCACARPFLARDGTLVFQEPGAHGASVVTANGLEFHDVVDVPERVVVRDPYEPWRAPLGFLIPKNGRFTKTSVPTLVATTGLAISLRPSDTRVPSWGGEMLVRVDVLAPAAAGTARWGGDIAFVLDGRSAGPEGPCRRRDAAARGSRSGRGGRCIHGAGRRAGDAGVPSVARPRGDRAVACLAGWPGAGSEEGPWQWRSPD